MIHTYQHDYKPGRFQLKGQQKPAALLAAIKAVDEAWADYDRLVDLRADHLAVDSQVDEARRKAIRAEEHQRYLDREWQDSFHTHNVTQSEPELATA